MDAFMYGARFQTGTPHATGCTFIQRLLGLKPACVRSNIMTFGCHTLFYPAHHELCRNAESDTANMIGMHQLTMNSVTTTGHVTTLKAMRGMMRE
jgi:hypothetical protein